MFPPSTDVKLTANMFLCLTLVILCNKGFVEGKKTSSMVAPTIAAIDKLVHYYESEGTNINFDGLFGLHSLNGQLVNLIKGIKPEVGHPVPDEILEKIKPIHARARKIIHHALANIQSKDKDYESTFLPMLQRAFRETTEPLPIRPVDRGLFWDPDFIDFVNTTEYMDKLKIESDNCLALLMGTSKREGDPGQALRDARNQSTLTSIFNLPCSIPPDCIEFMIKRGTTDYYTTHQVVYAIVAKVNGCEDMLTASLRRAGMTKMTLNGWVTELCSNIAKEVNETINAERGQNMIQISNGHEDLFLEQQLVCVSQGFTQMLSRPALRSILSWQQPSGCYHPNGTVTGVPVISIGGEGDTGAGSPQVAGGGDGAPPSNDTDTASTSGAAFMAEPVPESTRAKASSQTASRLKSRHSSHKSHKSKHAHTGAVVHADAHAHHIKHHRLRRAISRRMQSPHHVKRNEVTTSRHNSRDSNKNSKKKSSKNNEYDKSKNINLKNKKAGLKNKKADLKIKEIDLKSKKSSLKSKKSSLKNKKSSLENKKINLKSKKFNLKKSHKKHFMNIVRRKAESSKSSRSHKQKDLAMMKAAGSVARRAAADAKGNAGWDVGCDPHMSGMAAGALGVNLYWAVVQPKEVRKDPVLVENEVKNVG